MVSLPIEYRASRLAKLAIDVREKGMTFGFADNDVLLHPDGNAYCAASNLCFRNTGYFTANGVPLPKHAILTK